jgi:hypothetical protein
MTGTMTRTATVLMLASVVLLGCGSASTEAPVEQAEVSARQTQASQNAASATSFPSQDEMRIWIKSITISPSLPNKDQVLTAQIDWQPQGTPGVAVSYRWFVNGAEVTAGYRSDLPLSKFRSGDRVYVTAAIQNPEGKVVASQQSRSVVIQNRPPVLQPDIEGVVKRENELLGHIRYSDPDGDKVTVRLLGGPPGLVVDPDGTLRWPLSMVQSGAQQLTVELIDEAGLGYRGTLTFSLEAGG